jgi:hypothetical protein
VIDAKLLASDGLLDQSWSGAIGVASVVARAQHTKRTLRDIAHDVVTCADGQGVGGASTPPVYRFTL